VLNVNLGKVFSKLWLKGIKKHLRYILQQDSRQIKIDANQFHNPWCKTHIISFFNQMLDGTSHLSKAGLIT